MTAKRFTFDEDVNEDDMYELGVFLDNGNVMETIDVLNCLNNLHEENEQLKSYDTITDLETKIMKLKKENEHIKHTIKTMMENERTELGRSVLKQLWEQIQ